MGPLRIATTLLLAALLAACTPMQWQHASLGVAPSQAEVGECNQSAFYEAQRQAFLYDFGWPRYYGPWGPRWPRYSSSDRFFLERDLFDYCMRARGYRLVPAPNS
jgi:hypothetical protein